jgi:hypothetical protein
MNELITELIDGTMELVLSHHTIPSSTSSNSTITNNQLPNNFFLIYNDAIGFEFAKENQKKS